jgi:hypothetical protein
MTTEDAEGSAKREQSLRELSWFDRFAQLFNRTAIGAGVLALGWLVLNAYWMRAGMIAMGLVIVTYLQYRLDTP